MLVPRVTQLQINTLHATDGVIIYNIDINDFMIRDDSTWKLIGSGGSSGVTTLNNGLTLTGSNGQLGGALTKNTTIIGDSTYGLNLGTKSDKLSQLYVQTDGETEITSAETTQLGIRPKLFEILTSDDYGDTKAIKAEQESGLGIVITDDIDGKGLNGSEVFSPAYDTGYVQERHLRTGIENLTVNERWQTQNITVSFDIPETSYGYLFLGNGIAQLPASSLVGNGKVYSIKNIGAGSISLTPTSGETIDGQPSVILSTQYEKIKIVSNGTNWYIIN